MILYREIKEQNRNENIKNIEIICSGSYLPKTEVNNKQLEKQLNLEEGYIEKRTGIEKRYYAKEETIEEMAKKSVKDLLEKLTLKNKVDNLITEEENQLKEIMQQIGLIIVATTTPNYLMPGIANKIQKYLEIENCISLDILAGCSGYINAIDISRMYLATGKVEKALVIGVDKLSKYTEKEDVGTSIILSDGAGAILLSTTSKEKVYMSNIKAEIDEEEILTCKVDEKIKMNGKEIYKYAVTNTVKNINELLDKSNEKLENIKYIIPHQSNTKIMKSMMLRLKINESKMYMNIKDTGNTFCASIPIVLNEMYEKNLLHEGDKAILIGYGGGLNTGSILLEI